MAGLITYDDPSIRNIGQSPSYSYRATLTLDASGDMNENDIHIYPGYIIAIDTIPDGSSPPSAGWSMQLLNDDGVDVLVGECISRSAISAERILMQPSPVRDTLTPVIAGGGANAVVDIVIWMQGL